MQSVYETSQNDSAERNDLFDGRGLDILICFEDILYTFILYHQLGGKDKDPENVCKELAILVNLTSFSIASV